jgi:RNA polymerase sigma-70 factor (ECF subfamily)
VTPGPDEPSDGALVLLHNQGDHHALETLLARHKDDLTRILWRFTRRRADLEDLVQDALLRIVRGLPGWRDNKPFPHWIRRIAANVGRDYYRRGTTARRWIADHDPDDGEPEHEATEPSADPAARAASAEVMDYLAQLPPDDRTLLTLHYLEGWDFEEIGRLLGWSAPVTKVRAFRARRRLRALLPPQEFL